jgi:hypothetical protein
LATMPPLTWAGQRPQPQGHSVQQHRNKGGFCLGRRRDGGPQPATACDAAPTASSSARITTRGTFLAGTTAQATRRPDPPWLGNRPVKCGGGSLRRHMEPGSTHSAHADQASILYFTSTVEYHKTESATLCRRATTAGHAERTLCSPSTSQRVHIGLLLMGLAARRATTF